MVKITSFLTILFLVAVSSFSSAAGPTASTATLEGRIMQSNGVWVLRLPARLSVTIGKETGVSRDLQLVGLSKVGALVLNNLDGKEVRLNGRLALAHTRHHVQPVLFIVSDTAVRKLAAAAAAD